MRLSIRASVRIIKTVGKRGRKYRRGRGENMMHVCAGGREMSREKLDYFDRYWRAVNVPGE